jgi:hypothetical protein
MAAHEDLVKEYKQRQAELRRQIDDMRAGRFGAGGKTLGTGTADAIKQAEDEILTLDRAIAKARQKAARK